MKQLQYTRHFVAEATLPPRCIVAFGSDDDHVLPAGPEEEKLLGISLETTIVRKGQPVEVAISGPAFVLAGASLKGGESIAADNNGAAVAARPDEDTSIAAIGRTMWSASAQTNVLCMLGFHFVPGKKQQPKTKPSRKTRTAQVDGVT